MSTQPLPPAATRTAGFRMWTSAPPEEPWAYIVDDFGVVYGSATLWPFYRRGDWRTRRELMTGTKVTKTMWSVRVSPDTDYRSWNQEYATLYPNLDGESGYSVGHVFVRPQGQGGVVAAFRAEFDLRRRTFALKWLQPGSTPEEDETIRAQAEMKARKMLAFLLEHMRRRDEGRRKVPTAQDRLLVARGQRDGR